MSTKITMESIAKKLGVSKNTVSLALRNMPGISEETKKTILEEAIKSGYKYKKSTYDNTLNKQNNICLILSTSTRDSFEFFSHIQFGIQSEAETHNFNVILYCYDKTKYDFEMPNCIKDKIVSGIITLGNIEEITLSTILTYNLPIVMVDDYIENINVESILTDNFCGSYTATKYIIDNGHKDIAFCGNINASISFYERFLGFQKALKDNNIEFLQSNIWIDKNTITELNKGVQLAIEYIGKIKHFPTSIVCCNDIEAICLIKAFESIGMNVPTDISIIGFDDIASSSFIGLTTMKVCKKEMGERAIQKLLYKIENPLLPIEKTLISTTLIKRTSVKRI